MKHVVAAADLPRFDSTRDNRQRIDLVTEELWGFAELRADHITYAQGDTAAAHYHVGARHIWFIDAGTGVLHVGGERGNEHEYALAKGDVASVADGEVHWFENTGTEPFSFFELWVPAPSETVWIKDDDI
jgi:mannose-6-phosphate isomerase-like protein (cupin superfamily)